jgi:hypothetical protein
MDRRYDETGLLHAVSIKFGQLDAFLNKFQVLLVEQILTTAGGWQV